MAVRGTRGAESGGYSRHHRVHGIHADIGELHVQGILVSLSSPGNAPGQLPRYVSLSRRLLNPVLLSSWQWRTPFSLIDA